MSSCDEILEILMSLGFEQKEAVVYLKSVGLGRPVPVSLLAKVTKFNRATVYYITDRLEKKGLLKKMILNDVLHFGPEPFSKIEQLLIRQEKDLQKKKDIVKNCTQSFCNLFNVNEYEKSIKVFQGAKQVRKLYQLCPWQEYHYAIFSAGRYDRFLGEDTFYGTMTLDNHRSSYGKILHTQTVGFQRCNKLFKLSPKTKIKTILNDECSTDTMIFDNFVVIVNLNQANLYGVKIESPLLLKSYRSSFEQMWNLERATEG